MDNMDIDAKEQQALLEALQHYNPSIPEELVEYYLRQSGFASTDPTIVRLVALAAHKFLLDVSHDTMQYQRIRLQSSSTTSSSTAPTLPSTFSSSNANNGISREHSVLCLEDLEASLKDYGVNISKPEYYSDT